MSRRGLRVRAPFALLLCGALLSCHEQHTTSVAETSIEGAWVGTVALRQLGTGTFRMEIRSADERNLTVTIFGKAGGIEQHGVGTGTFNDPEIALTVTSDDFYYATTGTFVGQRTSYSELQGHITYDVITTQQPIAVTFQKVPRKKN